MSGAVKFDQGKPRMDLLPADALLAVATVLTYGAAKYGDRNWERGLAWGRMHGAALRHLAAWSQGEELDDGKDGSGLPHLTMAATNLLMLIASTQRGIGADDRTQLREP